MVIAQIILSLFVFVVAGLAAYTQSKSGNNRIITVMWTVTSLTSAANIAVIIAGVMRG